MISFYNHTVSLSAALGGVLKSYSAVFVLCDEHTSLHCLPLLPALTGCNLISISSGEKHKNIDSCGQIWETLTLHHADRGALLVNLGGGVITDIGGFAAGCYKRGIDFLHVPTTLLAMADAAIGGKTGIDLRQYKNQIGLFRDAKAVLVCPAFLSTLDSRQLRSGMAEVIKHYLIADRDAFMKFAHENNRGNIIDTCMIKRAIEIKSAIVAADPYESGLRRSLNFGHTVGHALESYTMDTDSALLHGEAIAVGMAVETIISRSMGIIDVMECDMILALIIDYFEPPPIPDEAIDAITGLALQDKKNSNGIILMSLPAGIGECLIDVPVSRDQIKAAIFSYNQSMTR